LCILCFPPRKLGLKNKPPTGNRQNKYFSSEKNRSPKAKLPKHG
jgi:hypothetical protein